MAKNRSKRSRPDSHTSKQADEITPNIEGEDDFSADDFMLAALDAVDQSTLMPTDSDVMSDDILAALDMLTDDFADETLDNAANLLVSEEDELDTDSDLLDLLEEDEALALLTDEDESMMLADESDPTPQDDTRVETPLDSVAESSTSAAAENATADAEEPLDLVAEIESPVEEMTELERLADMSLDAVASLDDVEEPLDLVTEIESPVEEMTELELLVSASLDAVASLDDVEESLDLFAVIEPSVGGTTELEILADAAADSELAAAAALGALLEDDLDTPELMAQEPDDSDDLMGYTPAAELALDALVLDDPLAIMDAQEAADEVPISEATDQALETLESIEAAPEFIPSEEDLLGQLLARIDEEMGGADRTIDLEKQVDATQREPYVVFKLGETDYGISTDYVLEVGELTEYTAVPFVPDWLLGITNLRGDILSLVDLRIFFEMPPTTATLNSYMIVISTPDNHLTLGIVVDDIRGYRQIPVDQRTQLTTMPHHKIAPYIDHVYLHNDELIVGLDFDSLLNSAELRQFDPL